MKLIIILCTFTLGLVGCNTRPPRTGYHPYGYAGGYTDGKIDEQRNVARFAGNAYTPSETSLLFSKLRAIEVCTEDGYRLTQIFGSSDRSQTKTVTQTTVSSYANPFFSGQSAVGRASTWDETFRYPTYDTYFVCLHKHMISRLSVATIKVDDMKPYVKDLLGAVQVLEIPADSPNLEKLQIGDLIVKANAIRAKDVDSFGSILRNAKDKTKVRLLIIREGKSIETELQLIDQSDDLAEENNAVIEEACSFAEVKALPICTKNKQTERPQDG